ncbi:hypothetical protein D3C73_1455560 [compost metagenome]
MGGRSHLRRPDNGGKLLFADRVLAELADGAVIAHQLKRFIGNTHRLLHLLFVFARPNSGGPVFLVPVSSTSF